jgi:hypothetical protein
MARHAGRPLIGPGFMSEAVLQIGIHRPLGGRCGPTALPRSVLATL